MSEPIYAEPRAVESIDDCAFYHTMELPGVGVLPGNFDLRGQLDVYLGPVDFAGKRVLEIGPGSGFLTFEMEKRGAEVVSIELADDIPWDYVPYALPEKDAWLVEQRAYMARMRNGYWYAHKALDSKARVHYGSAYRLPDELGRFDIAVMAAVLLHNRDPLGIMANCARLTDGQMVIVDQYHADLDAEDDALLRLVPTLENRMPHTWWHFAPDLVRRFLAVLGFDETHFGLHTERFASDPGGATEAHDSYTIVAERKRA